MIVETSKGLLEHRECCTSEPPLCVDDDRENTHFVEWWLGGTKGCQHDLNGNAGCKKCPGELIHRSVKMHLKTPMVFSEGGIANF